jgi:(p)ppGpp synthase/HD superfamily hydrolase
MQFNKLQEVLTMSSPLAKRTIALRYWLLGKEFHSTLSAMEFAQQWHNGLRKDGSPEFSHQIDIMIYLRTLGGSIQNLERCLTVAALHDVVEDYDVSTEELDEKFGTAVALAVGKLTKPEDKSQLAAYFEAIASDIDASIVKGADRIHNHSTMVGPFSLEKRLSYLEETEKWILPMLKEARRNFTVQELAYENMKLILNTQIKLIRAIP